MRAIAEPHFGEGVRELEAVLGPRELFCRLQDPEENVHCFKPAFRFAEAAVTSARLVPPSTSAILRDDIDGLLGWARATLAPVSTDGCASSWALRVAGEFAPVGLTDGIWLQGAVQLNAVENHAGMALLRQLMDRFGDPGTSESHAQRYATLLRSIGVPPGSITRWEPAETSPCAGISYEHALLGATLSVFPTALLPETIGFNLWMAGIGPCPLLEQILGELRRHHAICAYFEDYPREALLGPAITAARAFLEDHPQEDRVLPGRIMRGFLAAHRSYQRWEQAMLGRNIPRTPRDFVLEILRRKAPFAAGHHDRIRINGRKLEDLLGDRRAHPELLSTFASSPWVTPGVPEESRFLTEIIAFGGPMFDIFSAGEQRDLREWIAGLDASGAIDESQEPLALEGLYGCPQDPTSLSQYAVARYQTLAQHEVLYAFTNADQQPAARVYARIMADQALATLAGVLDTDPRLGSTAVPKYSEQQVAEIIAANHLRNVRSRLYRKSEPKTPPAPGEKRSINLNLLVLFDGSWLQGFADVQRIHHEEYGWLFRIYASELGDGDLAWNHNYIARQMAAEEVRRVREAVPAGDLLPDDLPEERDLMLPLTDRRLYDVLPTGFATVVMLALTLNRRHFLPELLGLNLAIEARGVCGFYVADSRDAAKAGDRYRELYFKLHNSIDNYSSGHTKWSLAAVQAYMARIKDAAPDQVEAQWRRIWRLWRFNEIQEWGTPEERHALEARTGLALSSFVPSEIA